MIYNNNNWACARFFIFGLLMIILGSSAAAHTLARTEKRVHQKSRYHQEFKAFKKSDKFQAIFDRTRSSDVRSIQRDVENNKELSFLQRLIRIAFWGLHPVVVTSETMPALYAYVDGICKEHKIARPTIFITIPRDGFFNAAAQKLMVSSGAIVIGQQLLRETTDAELEAVVAHELGHIYHNHINKDIALSIGLPVAMSYVAHKFIDTTQEGASGAIILLSFYLAPVLTRLIINKRFENQADEFAYKVMNKGEGLIGFFDLLLHKEAQHDKDLANTLTLIFNARSQLYFYDYYSLLLRYCSAVIINIPVHMYRWVYYNTPYGPHPSPEVRIETVKNFLAQ